MDSQQLLQHKEIEHAELYFFWKLIECLKLKQHNGAAKDYISTDRLTHETILLHIQNNAHEIFVLKEISCVHILQITYQRSYSSSEVLSSMLQ